MNKKIKVHVPYGGKSYTNWLVNKELVDNIEDADLVFMTGGEDANPALYGEKVGRYTYFNQRREDIEVAAMKKAISLGIPMFGTCKGLQMINIMAGGTLVQDMDHPGGHGMMTTDGQKFRINSLHHQCINPYNLPKEDYEILAVSDVRSKVHLNGDDIDITKDVPEDIEVAFFPKIKALGTQFHNELLFNNNPEHPLFQWHYKLIKDKLGLDVLGESLNDVK